ncbi:MAG TPA: hypothetical protein VFX67_04110 [Burkholderiales bacterium]|nr:hypothetical protein [Burkholderiales bacterium]
MWYANWLKEKRVGVVLALHRRGTYILELDEPLPAPHCGNKTVAFGYELESLSELRLLHRLDPEFERFMRIVLWPIDLGMIASENEPLD